MKLTTAKPVMSVVVLVTIIVLMASIPGYAKKKSAENNQSSTNNPAIDKPAKATRNSTQNSSVSPVNTPGTVPSEKGHPPVYDSRSSDRRQQDAGSNKQPGKTDSEDHLKPTSAPTPPLKTRVTPTGLEKTTPSGVIREKIEKRTDGEHTQHFAPTGRKEREEVAKPDGTVQKTYYNPGGKVNRQETVHTDGSREVSNQQWGRDNKLRAKETIQYDSNKKAVSKTVEKTVIINKTVNKTVIVNHYDVGRYGFVYHPEYAHPQVFVAWYDPYWYSPEGVVIYHPFHYAWGWENAGWYQRYHGSYWTTYEVYPAPSYWVTDRVMADYMADHYEARVTADQARQEAQQAREEAKRAQQVAQQAQDEVEIAGAKNAQLAAELRAKSAEDKVARLEREEASRKENAGQPNPKATPIDSDTKQALEKQIETTIAEKKQYANQAGKGDNPPLPDVSKSLADPQHIYLVSVAVSVTSAKDSSPAGSLSEGDMLKVEPGQEIVVKNLSETTMIPMRVIASKGEDGEVTAGTSIQMPVKQLQEFDNEYSSKIDVSVNEAADKMGEFRQGGRSD